MKPLSALVLSPDTPTASLCARLADSPLLDSVILMQPAACLCRDSRITAMEGGFPPGGRDLESALALSRAPLLLVITEPRIELEESELLALVNTAAAHPDAAMLYFDFFDSSRSRVHPLIPCQLGSIRDDFFFGPLQLYCREKIERALCAQGALSNSTCAGLYELRLKASCVGSIRHVAEPIGCVAAGQQGQAHFAYVDPANRERQHEMELAATEHLERIGALCRAPARSFSARNEGWPVEASIIIPVRNRCGTIAEAVQSALSQTAPFSFNVLVVDNHSTDGTTDIIRQRAGHEPRLVHIVPPVTGLGIGGCWNAAVQAEHCGRFVCQLDSDDLYAGEDTLVRMIELLQQGCGMAVGSYRLVNFALEEIPPGIVDHREWTPENGRNNLLRVQGIGAPRAFATELLRLHPFPDVSYGEDYAVALRISRDYRVGRIYEPLYLCRRWEGNSDAQLPVEQANRFALYKDTLRTREIEERRRQNQSLPRRPGCSE
ncbi:MAG: glycosyltransferase family 2 protein [Deltaproteobacteria bacterium]|nr:glycosyltransferase family 2 protein [Deltaproteobacteria bacterium]